METLTTDKYGAITGIQVITQLLCDDSGQYVAYCPALELSSYGDTEAEAHYAFEETLAFFKQDVTQRGTLNQLLLALGWQQHSALTTITYNWS
ncbi:type II toxin-antitoxin system HicB family antitoxin [Hymenobacter caeli]|uniref:RNase H-like HicB family nuclease n=1 Tax=Hymenobacter caeli TaxID=2735894 RepID=A0ABX2FNL6_9BACT|nr:hypothetical protein [Hymenobacter caeli]NRT18765.1 putative RNase H-like HicB family nuclease [Hymenobacter caeli]